MDRHVPVHPLPEELQKMSRDETVCKYCGVSYLILHEFKMLEEKVKVMEEKVKFCEGSVQREKHLQETLQRLYQDFGQCTAASESKTERIQKMQLELEQKQDAIQNLNEQLRCLQKERDISQRQGKLLRKAVERHQTVLKKAFALLPFIRGELKNVKADIFGNFNKWTALKGQTFLQIKNMNNTALAEISSLNQRLVECQRENVHLQAELRSTSEAADAEMKQLQTSVLQKDELQNRCNELQRQTQDLTSQVERTELRCQKAAAEMGRYKELVTKKSKEVEDCQCDLRKLKSEIGTSESRFTNTLKEQEQSLLACQQECKRLQEEVVEREREEEGLKKRTSHLESELETIKNHLGQREEEVVMLKQERESYQSRMKELQETLEQTVMKEKNWQEKVASLICSAVNNVKTEMGIVEKELEETRTKLVEKNKESEEERQRLGKQVMDLETRLSEEKSAHHTVTADLMEEIKKKSYELEKLTQEQAQLIQNLNHIQEENALLQDTVRRECEERYELTEALTQAREQVMELKKLRGNFSLSPPSLSQGSLTSSTALVSGHGQGSLHCGRGRTPTGLCGVSRVTKGAPSGPFKSSSSSSSNMGGPGLPALQPSSRRASSLNESRRRMVAAIARQLSQQ